MRKVPYFITALLLISTLTYIGVADESSSNHKFLSLCFSDLSLDRTETYVTVNIEGTNARYSHTGRPILPIYRETFTFPFGTRILNVSCSLGTLQSQRISGTVEIASEPFSVDLKKEPSQLEDVVKSQRGYFPDNWFIYYTGGGIDNSNNHVTFLTLQVFPVRYNRTFGDIIYADEIIIDIEYEEPTSDPFPDEISYDLAVIAPLRYIPTLLRFAAHKNRFGIETIIMPLPLIYNGYTGLDKPEQIKLFIKDAIEQWGISSVLLIGGLKSTFIGKPRDNVNEGTKDWYVPVRYSNLIDNDTVYDPGFISDLYYADIYDGDGHFCNWDSNGDGVYGGWSYEGQQYEGFPFLPPVDSTDVIDFYPDIQVGRLPVRNIFELKIIVNKIISYEQKPADPEWFNKIIAIAGDPYDDDDAEGFLEGELIADKALSYMQEFTPIQLYASNKIIDPLHTPLKTNIIREISEGSGFLLFDGHGSPCWWNTFWPHEFDTLIEDGGLTIFDFPRLTNAQKLPICIIGGCHCGTFNVSLVNTILDKDNSHFMWSYGQPIPECFSWWLTRKIGGGSIATIATTGLGYEKEGEAGDLDGDGIDEPDCVEALGGFLERQFFQSYGENHHDVLGEVWVNAITQYLEVYPGLDDPWDAKTVEQWVLFGDPTLKIGGYL